MKTAGVCDGRLFTERYCNICNAQLISESQRVAHYESKKHANKVRLFYMLHPEDGGPPSKRLRPDNPDSSETEVDVNKCCTLCNMFFTSAIVAQSHYRGKTHAKRLRLVLGEPAALPPGGKSIDEFSLGEVRSTLYYIYYITFSFRMTFFICSTLHYTV
uniref:C2H2-type domain-containing protein n=1 Tax=Denticeps clupeoides TaxID=299321 RepID=A0AAY4EDZ9_9TELE